MSLDLWPAPTAVGPVHAVVRLPGSKSMTNRALVLAALGEDECLLRGPLQSRDTLLMTAGLRALGAEIDVPAPDGGTRDAPQAQVAEWRVRPGRSGVRASVDVGNAGTVMRFLPPVAALGDGDVSFDGDPRARERPVGPLLAGLRALGARISASAGATARSRETADATEPPEAAETLPFTVHGRGRVTGGALTLDASSSSQFVSGLLLAAPRFDKGLELRHEGPPMPSAPHVAMTVAMLRASGVDVDTSEADSWRVAPATLRPGTMEIEPDLSNAAPFLAAALVTGGQVRVAGWPASSDQPGVELRELLRAMGATTLHDGSGLTVRSGGGILGIDADLRAVSELVPVLAALAALAQSPSRLRGIGHMRQHETDRLAALARELGGLGARVTQLPDGLEIHPQPLHGGVFHSYDDHRLATAGALLGLAVEGVTVENIATTGKTLPGFTELWSQMLQGKEMGDAGDTH